jgi:hypothetical protein
VTPTEPGPGHAHNEDAQGSPRLYEQRIMQSCLARRTGPDVSASSHLGYASAGRAAMLGDLSTAIPTQNGEPRH